MVSMMGFLASICVPVGIVLSFLALPAIKIIKEWEIGLLFKLGKYKHKLKPGINFIIPWVDNVVIVDTRIQTVDIPKQEAITKDNISLMVNGVVYFRVEDAEKAIIKIQAYRYAVAQYSQTALRDVVGEAELDYLLNNREDVADKIKAIVDKETSAWGVDITSIKIQDIELPLDMKRMMARQAEAEREKRATIIKSEGEVIAAKNLTSASEILSSSPASIHLRTLQTISDISSDPSTKYVFTIPLEVLNAFKAFSDGTSSGIISGGKSKTGKTFKNSNSAKTKSGSSKKKA